MAVNVEALVQHAKDRRERIATAVLAGFAADEGTDRTATEKNAVLSVEWADALIAELDK